MSLSSSSVSSIELVHAEIDTTIQQAESSLERFQENRDSSEDLQNCIDYLNQLRGIFVVIEVQGCVLLCQEAVALANEVPVGANADKNGLLSSLSNAIFILRRYTEYFSHKKNDHPELLLPIINELRLARKAKPYPESHFFEFDSSAQFALDKVVPLSAQSSGSLTDFEHHARRFRHMYQVGLLDLLKDHNLPIAFKLLARAAEGSASLSAGQGLSQFWLLVTVVARALARDPVPISVARKRLFMKIERYLREMSMLGKVAVSKQAPDSLKKELVYVLSLSGDDADLTLTVLSGFGVIDHDLTDAILREESRLLFGPGADVLRSLSKAIHEEMTLLKEKLDVLERGGDAEPDDLEFIARGLERLGGTLRMLDLGRIASFCAEQVKVVEGWAHTGARLPEAQLVEVADAILSIEQAIKYFEDKGHEPDQPLSGLGSQMRENTFLTEARIIIISESQAGLALAKRAITSFIDSGGDKLHLANIAQVMDGVRGAMLMIEQDKAAALVMSCLDCINTELYESEQAPTSKVLETLADAISSVEYYIESMQYSNAQNAALLKLAEDSLSSIGYS